MRIALFYPSLLSDWKNGIAHFIRGTASELTLAGHEVAAFEPHDSPHLNGLLRSHGTAPLAQLKRVYPSLACRRFDPGAVDFDAELANADLVIAHEAVPAPVLRALGAHRLARGNYRLLFHYTHHSPATDPRTIDSFGLDNYDGTLVSCEALARMFVNKGWTRQAWVWREAADTRVFYPRGGTPEGDVAFVGNYAGDGGFRQFAEFLAKPVAKLGVSARVQGVGYPADVLELFASHGIDYAGWLPNYQVPDLYACYRATVHVPRAESDKEVPGLAPIRLLEAMACGLPVVSGPWDDADGLFEAGRDYLPAKNGAEAARALRRILDDAGFAQSLAGNARRRILAAHTCAHRARELTEICRSLGLPAAAKALPEKMTAA